MKVIEVTTPKLIKEFLKVHRTIHKDDKYFVSHLDQDIEKVFDAKANRFFRHGKVTRWILVDAGNRTIGRVAAFVNEKLANTFSQPTGGMGFFECINNQEAAFLLFDTCTNWLKEQGMEAMEGPINFGEKDKYWGLTIKNFEAVSYYQQNYNPEYYVTLFKAYGFEVYYEQFIYYRDLTQPLQKKFQERAERLHRNPKYRFQTIDPKNLDKFAEDFRAVYNRAWAGTHKNFGHMSKAKAMLAMKAMKPIMDKDLVYFAYYEDKPIAFFIAIPNLNDLFRYVDGNLNWWGKIKFLYHKWRGSANTCVGMVFGVDPDFQGKGIEGGLFQMVHDLIHVPKKYDHLYIAWIGDFNPKMIRIVEDLGTELFRTMATCMYLFDRSKPFKRRPLNEGASKKGSPENTD